MTDQAIDTPVSTNLGPDTGGDASGGGQPRIPAEQEAEAPEKLSVRDAVSKALKDSGGKPTDDADPAERSDKDEDGKGKDEKATKAKDDAKPKEKAEADSKSDDDLKAEKAARADEDAKAAKAAKSDDNGQDDDKSGHYQPPKNFMADSREKWTNVPRPVQRDIDSMVRQNEARVAELTKATERYESLREFDELAQSNGRDLRESLTKMAQIEDLMQANPYAGLNAILQEIGPKKPDGSTPTLFEVAQFITQQGPQKWQQIVGARPQAQNDQQQPNSEVAALKRELDALKTQQTAASVIEPFKANHPRYDELKGDIAMFLKSGKIDASLSPSDRLAVAYDMAERINPPSNVEAPAAKTTGPDADGRADLDLSGTKSIKSAPGSVSAEIEPQRGGPIRDVLKRNMRSARLTG